ncbi:MAG TPA: hypothetical protein VFO17_14265 [Acidimicrobiia bacterium]|jgi:hypothetical protein|nr:hypothetical protein [Acidimicrobiia bacterium]
MTAYEARLQIEGEETQPVPVMVDLTDGRLTMSIGTEQVAEWHRDNMRIQALPDGFHIRAEGEAVVLDVTDEARFALELGLKNAHPALRQKMAALLRNDNPV